MLQVYARTSVQNPRLLDEVCYNKLDFLMIFCSVLVVQRDMVTWDAEVFFTESKEVDSAILACKDGSVRKIRPPKVHGGGSSAVTMRRRVWNRKPAHREGVRRTSSCSRWQPFAARRHR